MKLSSKTGQTTIVVLDFDDEREALRIAKDIVEKTGCTVTVRKPDGTVVETLRPTQH